MFSTRYKIMQGLLGVIALETLWKHNSPMSFCIMGVAGICCLLFYKRTAKICRWKFRHYDVDYNLVSKEKRLRLFKQQRQDEKDWGYSEDNPIVTASELSNEVLLQLYTTGMPAGNVDYEYGGIFASQRPELAGCDIMAYDVYAGDEECTLYFCPYGFNSTKAPRGFNLHIITDLEDAEYYYEMLG